MSLATTVLKLVLGGHYKSVPYETALTAHEWEVSLEEKMKVHTQSSYPAVEGMSTRIAILVIRSGTLDLEAPELINP
jgi:hypothetical protein